jgi:hypothetical protein
MFALGCIQSRSCHTDFCPTGVATQDKLRQRALVVPDKAQRVQQFHRNTVESLAELIGAAGLTHPGQVRPELLMMRDATGQAVPMSRQLPTLAEGVLLNDTLDANALPEPFKSYWQRARVETFGLA